MRVISDISLSRFEFWAGAKSNAEKLKIQELDQLEEIFEDIFEGGMTDTQINDILWFDFSWVCEAIGLEYDEEKDLIIR